MPPHPPPEPRSVLARHVAELLHELATNGAGTGPVRVADAADGLACLILVWPVDARMPTAQGELLRPKPVDGGRERCREDILAVVRAAGRPLTRKEVVRALKDAGADHGAGTVAKALADLTRRKELVNLKDKRGYRLPGWVRRHPGLFDDA
jgi:hypothetical protein